MIGDRVDVLAPRSRTKSEGAAGNRKAIAVRGADIDHGGLFEVGNTSLSPTNHLIISIKAVKEFPSIEKN